MHRPTHWISALAAASLMACAPHSAIPTTNTPKMSQVESNLRAAQENHADQDQRAAIHLQEAIAERDEAQRLADAGEASAANRMLERAAVDAELAFVMARESNLRAEAEASAAKPRLQIDTVTAPEVQP